MSLADTFERLLADDEDGPGYLWDYARTNHDRILAALRLAQFAEKRSEKHECVCIAMRYIAENGVNI